MTARAVVGHETSASGEEGDNAAQKKDFIHIQFCFLEGRYTTGGDCAMGCNPTSYGADFFGGSGSVGRAGFKPASAPKMAFCTAGL